MVNFVAHAREMELKSAQNGTKTTQKRLKHVIFVHKSGSNIEYCGLELIKVCMKMKKRPRKAQKAVKSAEIGQTRQKSIICWHDL